MDKDLKEWMDAQERINKNIIEYLRNDMQIISNLENEIIKMQEELKELRKLK